jgi:hypothetical protein
MIVTIIFIAPSIEAAPFICKLKIAKSTEKPLCPIKLLSGGYKVHPAPTPSSITNEILNNIQLPENNHTLKLFKRGKAISAAPSNNGKKKLEKAPIKIGMTIKKIITKPCAVIKQLNK